jgi:hypothetical protein
VRQVSSGSARALYQEPCRKKALELTGHATAFASEAVVPVDNATGIATDEHRVVAAGTTSGTARTKWTAPPKRRSRPAAAPGGGSPPSDRPLALPNPTLGACSPQRSESPLQRAPRGSDGTLAFPVLTAVHRPTGLLEHLVTILHVHPADRPLPCMVVVDRQRHVLEDLLGPRHAVLPSVASFRHPLGLPSALWTRAVAGVRQRNCRPPSVLTSGASPWSAHDAWRSA